MLTWRMDLDAQEAAETGDEVPEEDEVAGMPKEAVVVTVPSDFTLEESCQALLDELASIIYRYAKHGRLWLWTAPDFEVGQASAVAFQGCVLEVCSDPLCSMGSVLLMLDEY